MTLKFVQQADREDLDVVLRRHNRKTDEFDFSDTPQRIDPPGALAGPTIGTVTITCRKTNISHHYSTGGVDISVSPLVRWVREFERDLESGTFDQ